MTTLTESKSMPRVNKSEEKEAALKSLALCRGFGVKALKGATMFITRYGHKDRSGGSRLAAPCRECSEELRRAMQENGLRSVYYTTTPENLDKQKVEWVEWSPTEQGYQRAKHSVRP